jgi:hypothetical protein
MSPDDVNIELLARGTVNHVRLTDEYGDYAPDDIVPYSMLERDRTLPAAAHFLCAEKPRRGITLEQPGLA